MPGLPYSKQEVSDFERASLSVCCLCHSDTLRGLKWALDKQNGAREGLNLELFLASLSDLKSLKGKFDLLLLAVDMGQPIPTEALTSLSEVHGVAAFVHPTPQQLLNLAASSQLHPVAWDGNDFGQLLSSIIEVANKTKRSIEIDSFIRASALWLKEVESLPLLFELTNCPDTHLGQRLFVLDPGKALHSIGGAKSTSDILLPLPETFQKKEVGELRFLKDRWSFRLLSETISSEYGGDPSFIKVEDTLILDTLRLKFQAAPDTLLFRRLASNWNVLQEVALDGSQSGTTLGQLIRDFLLKGVRGELRLISGSKRGVLALDSGFVISAVTGSVNGTKALSRMLGWDNPKWSFTSKERSGDTHFAFRLGIDDFSALHKNWRELWSKVSTLTPPYNVHLRIKPNAFWNARDWSQKSYKVAASIGEYSMVRDILNNCPLHDVEVIESLIGFRKQGLVELVQK